MAFLRPRTLALVLGLVVSGVTLAAGRLLRRVEHHVRWTLRPSTRARSPHGPRRKSRMLGVEPLSCGSLTACTWPAARTPRPIAGRGRDARTAQSRQTSCAGATASSVASALAGGSGRVSEGCFGGLTAIRRRAAGALRARRHRRSDGPERTLFGRRRFAP
jgi:hypothetical protein